MTILIFDTEAFGRAEGREEGRLEGQRDLVLRLLTRKLGPLNAALSERVAALTHEALLDLSGALLDFTATPDQSPWLDQHPRAEAR